MTDGMKKRREVLGDEHVDRAIANATEFTADFQELLTQFAWGDVWTRPGLDRKTRRCLTIVALLSVNRMEEFEIHVRAALREDLTADELKEVLLHCAVYCGIPAANSAFAIAQRVLAAATPWNREIRSNRRGRDHATPATRCPGPADRHIPGASRRSTRDTPSRPRTRLSSLVVQ